MSLNTSPERVDAMMHLGEAVHEAIDQPVSGVSRAQHILTIGVNSVGSALREGVSLDDAGSELLTIFHDQLNRSGLSINHPVYDAWPQYRSYIQSLPRAPILKETGLNHFASAYGKVIRATLDNEYYQETNARHAVHLMGWAVPYAMEYYPRLNPNRTALKLFFHDGIEAITQDVPSINLSPEDYEKKVRDEIDALPELQTMLGAENDRLFDIMRGYEELEEEEDHFSKTADKLDPGFTHFKTAGYALWSRHGISSGREFQAKIDAVTVRIMPYAKDFPILLRDREELTRRVIEITKWPHDR